MVLRPEVETDNLDYERTVLACKSSVEVTIYVEQTAFRTMRIVWPHAHGDRFVFTSHAPCYYFDFNIIKLLRNLWIGAWGWVLWVTARDHLCRLFSVGIGNYLGKSRVSRSNGLTRIVTNTTEIFVAERPFCGAAAVFYRDNKVIVRGLYLYGFVSPGIARL